MFRGAVEKSEVRAISCPFCESVTAGEVRGIVVQGPSEDVDLATEHTLIQCAKCNGAMVQIREDYGGGFDEDDRPLTVYPAARQLSTLVPHTLWREWDEARTCFRNKLYTATAVMVRRTLEGTCIDLGVQERILARGLTELKKRGLIDDMLAEWANALRVIGNEGAHFTGRSVSRQDAEDALTFAEALLDHVYVLRKRFEEFRQRLDKKRGQPAAASPES